METELIGSFIEYENVDNQELNEKQKNIKKCGNKSPKQKDISFRGDFSDFSWPFDSKQFIDFF